MTEHLENLLTGLTEVPLPSILFNQDFYLLRFYRRMYFLTSSRDKRDEILKETLCGTLGQHIILCIRMATKYFVFRKGRKWAIVNGGLERNLPWYQDIFLGGWILGKKKQKLGIRKLIPLKLSKTELLFGKSSCTPV